MTDEKNVGPQHRRENRQAGGRIGAQRTHAHSTTSSHTTKGRWL